MECCDCGSDYCLEDGHFCCGCEEERQEGSGNLYDPPYDHDGNVCDTVIEGTVRDVPVTFGVEMETQFDRYMDWNWEDGYQFEHGFSGWDSREDCTVHSGAEIVSPILRGAAGLAEIIHTAEVLRGKGGYNDESTGQHTTVAHTGRESWDAFQAKMHDLFYVVEEAFYALCGEGWRFTCGYGGNMKDGGGTGYRRRYSGGAVEMRYPPGTLDPAQIAVNVGVCSWLALMAHEMPRERVREMRATAQALDEQGLEYDRYGYRRYGFRDSDKLSEQIWGGLRFMHDNGWGPGGAMPGLPYDPDDPPTIILDDDMMGIGVRVKLPGRAEIERRMSRSIDSFCAELGCENPLTTPKQLTIDHELEAVAS